MALTPTDLTSIVRALKPEFDKAKLDIQAALKPEFDKVRQEAKQNFNKLNKKIDSLKRSNRKEHNTIINAFDKRDLKLQERVTALETKSLISPFKNF